MSVINLLSFLRVQGHDRRLCLCERLDVFTSHLKLYGSLVKKIKTERDILSGIKTKRTNPFSDTFNDPQVFV